VNVDLALSDFSTLIGHPFQVTTTAGEVQLVLVEAWPQRGGVPGGREPFALLFRGPASPRLNQAMYDFQHPARGTLAIFIVPVGVDPDGMLYEAVFA
jgi:hypothetical protein